MIMDRDWKAVGACDYLPEGKVQRYGVIKYKGVNIGHVGPGAPVGPKDPEHSRLREFVLASKIVELLNAAEVKFKKPRRGTIVATSSKTYA